MRHPARRFRNPYNQVMTDGTFIQESTRVSDRRNGAESDLDSDGARIRQRLRALRSRYPGVALATGLTHIHDDQVVIRAALTLPDGTSVSAHAAEPTDTNGLLDVAIELAEQRAMTRVLDLLGLGELPAAREPARPDETTPPPAAPPQPRNEAATPPLVDALRKATQRRTAAAEVEDQPSQPEPTMEEQPARPEATRGERPARPPSPAPAERRAAPAPPAAARQEQTAAADDDLDMADWSWTDFWKWARANELSTKGQVEQRIGRTIEGLSPHEVRSLLRESGIPL